MQPEINGQAAHFRYLQYQQPVKSETCDLYKYKKVEWC